MPELYCPHCGAGPLANKASLKSHVRYRCKKAPKTPTMPAENDPPTISGEGISVPPAPETPLLGQRGAPPPPELPPAAAFAPFNTSGLSPEEMDRRIQALVDARLRAALAPVEERLGAMLQNASSMIEDTCNKLPGLVEQQVQGMLGGGEQKVVDQEGKPALAPRAAAAVPGLGGLGGLLTPELLGLASKLLGAEDDSIGGIIAAIMKKQAAAKKRVEPLNAAMMTRGTGHMISWFKNKRVDPMSLARVTIIEADEIMKMPGVDGSTKSYWIGRKGEAANYLAALMLNKADKDKDGETPPPEAAV